MNHVYVGLRGISKVQMTRLRQLLLTPTSLCETFTFNTYLSSSTATPASAMKSNFNFKIISPEAIFSFISRKKLLPNNLHHFISTSIHPKSAFTYAYNENRSAERYFRTSPNYSSSVFTPGEGGPPGPFVQQFLKVATTPQNTQHPVTSPMNLPIVNEVFAHLKTIGDRDLMEVLYHLRFFAPTASAKDPDFLGVWSALDEECLRRMSTWDFDTLFRVADLWNGLLLARISKFHWNLVKRCFRKVGRLSKEQFIRFMFCLNVTRSVPKGITTFDMEYVLGGLTPLLTTEEVAIVAMTFFKTETVVKDYDIFEKIIEKVITHAQDFDSISVAAVAKFARFNSSLKSKNVLIRMQEAFLVRIDALSLQACTHLALIGTKSQNAHLELIQKVVRRMEGEVGEARLKELERIALVMTMFNVDCDRMCQLIVEELRSGKRAEEIEKYGRCLPAILHYMSFRDIFPEDLINKVLSEEFRKKYYGNTLEIYQRELYCLDFAVELERKSYRGHRLDPKTKQRVAKVNVLRISPPTKGKLSMYEKSVAKISNHVRDIVQKGPNFIHTCCILPQHNVIELVLKTDAWGSFLEIPEEFVNLASHEVKYIPVEDLSANVNYHLLLIGNRNVSLSRSELAGQGILQVRQLKKMGYSVHYISAFASNDESALVAELKQIIYDVTHLKTESSLKVKDKIST